MLTRESSAAVDCCIVVNYLDGINSCSLGLVVDKSPSQARRRCCIVVEYLLQSQCHRRWLLLPAWTLNGRPITGRRVCRQKPRCRTFCRLPDDPTPGNSRLLPEKPMDFGKLDVLDEKEEAKVGSVKNVFPTASSESIACRGLLLF